MSKKRKAPPKKAEQDATDVVEVPVEESVEEPEAAQPEEDWRDKYLRVLAELDNMRKRVERDRAQVHKYALEDLLRSLLPVLDALNYALDAAGDADAIRHGVELANNDAHRILADRGLTVIEALHQPFDPRCHEAVGMRPAPEHPAGTVVEEERRGYRLHDRVLRPSRVHIAIELPEPKAPQADDPEQEAPKQ